jgi:hypothetical protein
MKLIVTPEDIIKRCLWNDFQYYVLKDKDIEKVVTENKEFELNEEDALIIGLLKILETPNLVHRLKQQINNLLVLKSLKYETKLYIGKNNVVSLIENFKKNFPASYNCKDGKFAMGMQEAFKYADELLKDIEGLQTHSITIKDLTYTCLQVMSIKKLIDPKTKHKED